MAAGNLLGVICFFLALGAFIDHSEKKPSKIYLLMMELNTISFEIVKMIIGYTPYGVFSLLYPTIAMQHNLGKLITSVLILVCTLALGMSKGLSLCMKLINNLA